MTLADFIRAIGGPSAAAVQYGVTRPAVSNWQARGRLPDRLYRKTLEIAQSQGIAVLDDWFAPTGSAGHTPNNAVEQSS